AFGEHNIIGPIETFGGIALFQGIAEKLQKIGVYRQAIFLRERFTAPVICKVNHLVARKVNTCIAFNFGEIILQRPTDRWRRMSSYKFVIAILLMNVDPIDAAGILKKTVVTQLVLYIKTDQQHTGQADSQTADVDHCTHLVAA